MDIFATAITAGDLILEFIRACAAYSEDAKSLETRFQWDLRALKAIRDYFEQRQAQNANQQLSADDAALLERTVEYLDSLVSKVQRSLYKIKRKGFLHSVVNRGMWIARQADLKEMANEVYTWTQRFDVRVLGLPPELRTVIPTTSEAGPPTVVRSNNRLRAFLDLASSSKTTRARKMRLTNPGDIATRITNSGDSCFLPMQEGDKQLILASRWVSSAVRPESPLFDKLEYEMGVLAAALNCLDPAADLRLLRMESFFYHADTTQFIFTQVSPCPIVSMMTLEDVIKGDNFPTAEATLNQRFRLALKLAEAVFFLHTAGFVHKNITSSSIIALQRPGSTPSSSLGDSYLMGFGLIRGVDSRTSKEGAVKEAEDRAGSMWDFDIFQHPDRLCGESSLRYTKTYDVYSLGIVLLQIGWWEPLSEVVQALNEDDPSSWARELLGAVPALGPRTGEKYQRIVAWCLGFDGSEIVTESAFVEHVSDPLDEIVTALS